MGDNDERYVWKQAPYIPMSMVRKEVRAFGEAMEGNLRAKEKAGGWEHQSDLEWLKVDLTGAFAELLGIIDAGDPGDILSKAADVANHLMMICDRLGAFQEKSEGEFIIFHPEGDGDET